MEKHYAGVDVELIFGKGYKSSGFNNDALARTLDKIHAVGAKKVFCHVALKVLLQEELPLGILKRSFEVLLDTLVFHEYLVMAV